MDDDTTIADREPTEAEHELAHEPRCADHVQCEVLLAIEIAERRKAVGR
jgi:hypothetical protein